MIAFIIYSSLRSMISSCTLNTCRCFSFSTKSLSTFKFTPRACSGAKFLEIFPGMGFDACKISFKSAATVVDLKNLCSRTGALNLQQPLLCSFPHNCRADFPSFSSPTSLVDGFLSMNNLDSIFPSSSHL